MIVFQPWVGSRFHQATTRLLLLGESHYGQPHEEISRSTIHVVEQWRIGEWPVRYLTAAARLITGKELRQLDRLSDLEGVAFYNFVQQSMPILADRPTWAQFQASVPAFKAVLHQLDPTHVLATGDGLWDAMPEFDTGGEGMRIELARSVHHIGRYRTPSGAALAMKVPHLSRGFSISKWHNPVAAFLAMKP